MNQKDKRYIKNERIIKETFLRMLKQKNYTDITVSELCEECLISKHTFYSHYENKEVFVKALMDELIEGMFEGLDDSAIDKMQIDNAVITFILDGLYDYIEVHHESFYPFFLHDDTMNFSGRMAHAIRKLILAGTNINIHDHTEEMLVIDYVISGGLAMIKKWILYHDEIRIEEVKDLVKRMQRENFLRIYDIKSNNMVKR